WCPTPRRKFYPLSLHDALPISARVAVREVGVGAGGVGLVVLRVAGAGLEVAQREEQPELEAVGQAPGGLEAEGQPVLELVRVPVDRKSTRLNSSHVKISYAVFC